MRIAATAGDDPAGLAIIDVATRNEVRRVGWPRRDSIPEDVVWSSDEKYIVAGLYGEAGGAGDPQQDYFLYASRWIPPWDGARISDRFLKRPPSPGHSCRAQLGRCFETEL